MRKGSSISSKAGPSNEREPSETARLSDYHMRWLGETHRGRDGNDVAARGLPPDSDQAGRTSRRTVQDFSRCDTRRSGRAQHQHRRISNFALGIYPSLAFESWTAREPR